MINCCKIKYSIFLSIIFFGCSNSILNPNINEISYKEYYPAELGRSMIYEVEAIVIDQPSGVYDTNHYFVKEIFSEYFIDNSGDSAIKIERYYSDSEFGQWTPLDIWYCNLYENELHRIEENLRYVRLKSPIVVDNEWDGNKHNALDSLHLNKYRIDRIGTEFINQITYDSSVVIIQQYDSSLIKKILFQEIYAKHIGLIYKEETSINSQNPNITIPIEDRIRTGSIFKMQLISYDEE